MGWPTALRPAQRLRGPGWLLPAGAFCLPLIAGLWFGVAEAVDTRAWPSLLADTQFAPALGLSLWIGIASSVLALVLTLAVVTRLHGTPAWGRLHAALGAMLAVPHAAFAIGLALLLMPSGGLARVIALFTGWTSPPDVATVQDRFGLALILALVLKEVPFLLWNVAAQLQRVGQGDELARQVQVAATMGYSRRTAWARLVWPQLLPRLALPLLAVWAYSLSVVDMALVLGPTRPPTLAVLAWQWLLDADAAANRQGAAAALVLAACVVAGSVAVAATSRGLRPVLLARWTRGDRPATARPTRGRWPALAAAVYLSVLAMLVFVSFAGVWTFPHWLPAHWTAQAWQTALRSGGTLASTAAFALASAASGLLLAVAWMETAPARWDAPAAPAVFAPMLIPSVLLVDGLYRLTLHIGLDGRFGGVWLAHSLYAAPYVLIALAPAYRGFDPRYEQTALALGRSRMAVLWRVKWPMLLAPLTAAFSVGFAVSVAQYVSTQFVGAGRHATVTTEALTLASGGQRDLAAAFALLQAALPALMFVIAWWLGRAQARRLGRGADT